MARERTGPTWPSSSTAKATKALIRSRGTSSMGLSAHITRPWPPAPPATSHCSSPPASCGCSPTASSPWCWCSTSRRPGCPRSAIGLLLTLTLLGDTGDLAAGSPPAPTASAGGACCSLGAALMVVAGVALRRHHDFWLLLLAATIGVISPAATRSAPSSPSSRRRSRRRVPDRSGAPGSSPGTTWPAPSPPRSGALAGGGLAQALQRAGVSAARQLPRRGRCVYALLGVALARCSSRGSRRAVEAPPPRRADRRPALLQPGSACTARAAWSSGSRRSSPGRLRRRLRGAELRGLLVPRAASAPTPATLGAIFFGANILAGLSALSAARLAQAHRPASTPWSSPTSRRTCC